MEKGLFFLLLLCLCPMRRKKIVQDCRYIARLCAPLCICENTVEIVDKQQYRCTRSVLHIVHSLHNIFLLFWLYFDRTTKKREKKISLLIFYAPIVCVIVIIIGQAQVADLFQFEYCHQALLYL